ncbi:hypothetical protein GA0116948_10669 [Chitinophaga costaii]|uniref:Uncharacterized protein n=1 Tax=Chitinophaga costaii TaxID=1335309 RepID=A0A1C4DRQ5_9BACT|nr:hypothetical protein [Chitinophaga costaii]PUZ27757.1 hypothetical protein DCM91_05985 [Chitinophaga costaii]SCC33981.1 hypothetical protein GA0116948_10669 [Chitinophaga costaii]
MKRLLYALLAIAAFTGCSKDHDNTSTPSKECMADKLQLTYASTDDVPSLHTVIITFDVKNTGSKKYDVGAGSTAVYVKLEATTTNGKTYSGDDILTVTSLDAGATASASAIVDYGAGNAYKSYKVVEVYCK